MNSPPKFFLITSSNIIFTSKKTLVKFSSVNDTDGPFVFFYNGTTNQMLLSYLFLGDRHHKTLPTTKITTYIRV